MIHDPARALKFRQAAFVYLHVAILYEAAVIAMWQDGVLPAERMMGPVWIWLIAGALVAGVIFVVLLRWQHPAFAGIIWAFHSMRLPALISSAFIGPPEGEITHAFYITAIVVVMINLWMLARATWDL